MGEWYTSITDIAPNRIAPRGRPIESLMGSVQFGGVVYLLLTGKEPTANISSFVDAILVSSVDHGVTPPSALAARNAASTGAPLNAAIASGVLAVNRYHGGAIEGCMKVLNRVIELQRKSNIALSEAADVVILDEKTAGRRVPGFGHRVHTADPRAARLLELAKEFGVAGDGNAAASALVDGFVRNVGKPLPLNVDGAIAACLVDLNIDSALANAFFIIARIPGLVAHAIEEMTTQRPMRKIIQSDAIYKDSQ